MLSRQPSSRDCFVCGVANPVGLHIHFSSPGPGQVSAEYIVREEYQSYPGIVHGGIIAAMLDEAAGRAHMGDGATRFMYTAKLDVRYRKNVPVGRPLRLEGTAGDVHGRMASARSAIYDQDGTLLAEANALLVDIPATEIGSVNLDEIGWRVYSDEELGG